MKTLGQIAYEAGEAYWYSLHGCTDALEAWDALSPVAQAGWEARAEAVARETLARLEAFAKHNGTPAARQAAYERADAFCDEIEGKP